MRMNRRNFLQSTTAASALALGEAALAQDTRSGQLYKYDGDLG